MDDTTTDPHEALAQHERDLESLNAAAATAYTELVASADAPNRQAELPKLRADRDRARRAVVEAEAKTPALRAAVETSKARERAEADRARLAAEAEARRVEAEARRAQLELELAPHLAMLEGARARAIEMNGAAAAAEAAQKPLDGDELVAHVLGGRDKAVAAAHVRASLAAEAIDAAALAVEERDPKHPAARAARAQAKSLLVHDAYVEADELRALAAAARTLNLAMLERIDTIVAARGVGAVDLILASIVRDASAAPLPPLAVNRYVATWVGIGATEQEALACAARTAGASTSLPVDILGRLVLDGLVHEAGAVAAERERATELAARTAEFASLMDRVQWCTHPTPRGCLAAGALEIGRAIGRFTDDAVLEQNLERMVDESIGQLTAEMLSDVHHGRYSSAGPSSREPMLIRWPNLPTREEQIAKVLGVPLSRVPSLGSVAA